MRCSDPVILSPSRDAASPATDQGLWVISTAEPDESRCSLADRMRQSGRLVKVVGSRVGDAVRVSKPRRGTGRGQPSTATRR
jgi:hypothetical protein